MCCCRRRTGVCARDDHATSPIEKVDAAPAVTPAVATDITTTGGVNGYLPLFTGTSTVVDSIVYQGLSGVGIGRIPNATLDVNGKSIFRGGQVLSRTGDATTSAGAASFGLIVQSSVYNTSTKSNLLPYFQLQSEPTGNNTATTGATYNFLYYSGIGANPAETGLYFNPNGTIHFAAAQTFPITAGPEGPAGPTGPQGPAGPQGLVGPQGPSGSSISAVTYIGSFVNPGTSAGTTFFASPTITSYGTNVANNTAIVGSGIQANFIVSPVSCTVAALNVGVNNYIASLPDTTTIRVYKNAVATTMTCSANTDGSANPGGCTDSTHTFSVLQGDSLALGFVETNADPINLVTVSLVCQ